MGLLIFLLLALLVVNHALNVWARHRQGGGSFFDEARFWYGYPLWLEQIVTKAAPNSTRRILALAGLVIAILLLLLIGPPGFRGLWR